MQRRHLLLLALVAGGRASSALAGAPPSPYELKALERPDGQTTSLARTAQGRRLLVVVMKSVHCPVCIAQLARLEQASEQLRKLGVTTVGLSHDPRNECQKARRDAKLHTPVLSDPHHEVLRGLALWRADFGHPMPALLLFDRCGAERFRLLGRRPGERPEPALFERLRELERTPEQCQPRNA